MEIMESPNTGVGGKMKKINGFICGPSIYEYSGWTFEVHSYCGPWPLKKDGSPRERAGKKFFDMYDKFSKLTKSEQNKFIVSGGGCITF